MRQGADASSSTKGPFLRLQTVDQLLASGQYARVAELIQGIQATADDTSRGLTSHVLTAANRICLACDQAREEAERYTQGCREAQRREREMLFELREILDLLSPRRRARAANGISRRAEIDNVDEPAEQDEQLAGGIRVSCLGRFRLQVDHRCIDEWPNSRSKAIFKYLVAHREKPVPKEVLMECFWPEASPDAARNNLNVSIHALRKILSSNDSSISHILFREDCYLLNPDLRIWIDAEAFMNHIAKGHALERRRLGDAAVREFRRAEALYRGDFLEDDRYLAWADPLRHTLRESYRSLSYRLSEHCLDADDAESCEALCLKLLSIDACDEASHRQLMRCYSRQGHVNRALRQFELCKAALRRELDVCPSEVTLELEERLRNGQPI